MAGGKDTLTGAPCDQRPPILCSALVCKPQGLIVKADAPSAHLICI